MDQGIDPAIPSGPARFPDFLFLLRPMILIPVWTFYLLGSRHGSVSSGSAIELLPFLAGLVSFTALLGAIYIINQITDRETDRANRKLFLVSHSIIPLRSAWIEALLLIAFSFAVSLLLMPAVFTVILVVSLALGIGYSVEPVRFKRRPVLDVLSNAAGNGVLNTLAGWVAVGAPLEHLEILVPYPLAVASVHLMTALADINGDRSGGMRTSGVALGRRRGTVLAAALMVTAVITAAAVGNRPALYASLISLPLFLIPARAASEQARAAAVLLPAKGATLIFSVAAGFLFPLYIPALLVLILLTRLYYRRRFAMAYPSLGQ
jgi:4-hydroxybenzoate polyprenyltransferase